jgi:ferric-dicitrate binding protein FerR (iron transport regulator)
LKEELNPEGPLECPARCTAGCSADMSICLIGTTGDAGMNGLAKIHAVQGEVFVRMEDGGWLRATPDSVISDGVKIKTGTGSKASIYLDDGSKIFMDESTELNMAVVNNPVSSTTLDVILELVKGALFSDVVNRDRTRFEVDTTVSVFGVKGTKFEVSYDGSTAETKVYEGEVTATSKYGDSMDVGPSEKVSVSNGGFGDKQVFDQSAQNKWWEEQSGAGCCAGFAFLASALGIFLLKK